MNTLPLFFLFVFLISCNTEKQTHGQNLSQPTDSKSLNALSNETLIITTKNGDIQLKFYPNAAPKTVARISELVKNNFYNGLTFHRVIPDFVAQGGDPQGNGTGGSGVNIPAEFNAIPHELGTLSMARSSDPNSADSQFYICLNRLPHLDNQYTVFGKVISGIDIVKMIKPNDKMLKVYFK